MLTKKDRGRSVICKEYGSKSTSLLDFEARNNALEAEIEKA